MRAVIDLDGTVIEFVESRVSGAYPWLTKVGNQNLAARAGHLDGVGNTESASIEILIDNNNRQAVNVLGYPLRAPADVYDDDDELIMTGLVQSVGFGRALTLQIED